MTAKGEPFELRLLDGRVLAGTAFGPSDGAPVFYFHGLPGTRREAELFAEPAATRLGMRLVALERPGYAFSDPKPGRTILDWADDVAEAANQLGFERFSVIGFSGGCPYALACAWRMPARVVRCVVLEGLGPINGPGSALDSMGRLHPQRLMLGLGGKATIVLRFFAWLIAAWGRRFPRSLVGQMGKPDQRLAAQNPAVLEWIRTGLFVEPFRHGATTVVHELQLAIREWGFDLTQIKVPVKIVVGEQDLNTTPAMARGMAGLIPGAALEILPDSGHLVLFEHAERLLANALDGPAAAGRALP